MYTRIDMVSPPSYDSDDDAAATPRPGFSLLETYAYFGKRQNATTAACDLDNGKIQVTFCAVHPPRSSYFCVHATGLGRTKFAKEPRIVATAGPLALIYVTVDRRKSYPPRKQGEYFVYHAGGNPSEGRRPPSLKHLPSPAPNLLIESTLAIVRHCPRREIKEAEVDHDCGDCNYVIAALGYVIPTLGYLHYHSSTDYKLCRYHSKTETWSAEPMVPDREDVPYPKGYVCKCFTIGGEEGTVAWVDLGKAGTRVIIFCDVLAITDSSPRPVVLRCLDTPPKIKSFKRYSDIFAKRKNKSCYVRDIAFVDGSIVYIELEVRVLQPDSPIKEYVWKANTWKIKINHSLPLSSSQWQLECTFGSSEISKSMSNKLQAGGADTIIYLGQPILSLQDDGIVYILTGFSGCSKSWVLAIDMMKKTVKERDEFDTKREVYLFWAHCTPSRITKFLQVDQGTAKHKRQKMMSDSEDNMELDNEDDDEEELPRPPPPPPPRALTLDDLEWELACKPWTTVDEILQEREAECKEWERINQGQGSGAPVLK